MPRTVVPTAPGLLIVHEKTLRWTSALRGVAPDWQPVRTKTFRVLAERLEHFPASFALIECPPGEIRRQLPVLTRLSERFPSFRFAVLCPGLPSCSPEVADAWIKLLTEAGAVHVAGTVRDLFQLIPTLRNYLQSLPLRKTTLRESFRNRIPWK